MSEPEPTKRVPDDELSGQGFIGPIWIEAGPAFSARTRLAIRGLNVELSRDKEKVSLTLDPSLLDEVRARAGEAPLSAVVNELLHQALAQDRQRALLEDLEAEAGEAPQEVYERLLEQWTREDET